MAGPTPTRGRRVPLLRAVTLAVAMSLCAWWPGVRAQAGASTGAPAALALASDEEVPFITTPDRVTLAMLALAAVGPADMLIDLGSGDGRIVITAAQRFGARGLGVEIVPDLVARSQDNARRAGVADRAQFRVQDLFNTDLSAASVITLYLLPEVNLRLRPRLLALAPGTRIVSHDWDMGDWPPDRTQVLDVPEKTIGREKISRLHLWTVPARLQGRWCSSPGGVALQIEQHHNQVQATWWADGQATQAVGVVDGAVLRLVSVGNGGLPPAALWQARLGADGALLLTDVPTRAPLAAGERLGRSPGDACRP